MNTNNNNQQLENPKMGGGRHQKSYNKLTKEAKELILEHFENDFKRADKLFAYVPIDERFKSLKPIVKQLTTGNDEVSIKTKEIIFESLKEEFKKLKFYINQLPQDKRAIELRQYLYYLDKEQIETVFSNIRK